MQPYQLKSNQDFLQEMRGWYTSTFSVVLHFDNLKNYTLNSLHKRSVFMNIVHYITIVWSQLRRWREQSWYEQISLPTISLKPKYSALFWTRNNFILTSFSNVSICKNVCFLEICLSFDHIYKQNIPKSTLIGLLFLKKLHTINVYSWLCNKTTLHFY